MEKEKLNLLEKLSNIQNELKAPKGQYNSFGKYKYRSCEDILEALKPILKENRTSLVISDDLENIGERYYIKATATIYDLDSENTISNTAYAREEETKKGMDGSQITGTASSYARKYALNGLFNIDDTKDADTDEHHKQVNQNEKQTTKKPTSAKTATVENVSPATKTQIETITKLAGERLKAVLDFEEASLETLDVVKASETIKKLKGEN